MPNPQGTIVEIIRDGRGARAVVEVESAAVCARCASGRGCGAGFFAAGQGVRRLEVAVQEGREPTKGDVVNIDLGPGNLVRAALIVYGLPLTGAAAGAALAFAIGFGDGRAAATALAGLAVAWTIGRRWLRGDSCVARFAPTVSPRSAPGA